MISLEMKKGGRADLRADTRRCVFYLPYDLYEWAEAQAAADHRKLSNWLRLLLIREKERDEMKRSGLSSQSRPPYAIPLAIAGTVAAGTQIMAQEDGSDTMAVSGVYPPGSYLVRIAGKSMEPDYQDGDVAVVQPLAHGTTPKTGKDVIYSDSSGSSLKRYRSSKTINGEKVRSVLESLNPRFPDLQTSEEGRIDGVVIDVIRAADDQK